MKQLFVLILALNCLLVVNGQNKDLKKRHSFGFQFSGIDFATANDLRSMSIASVVGAKKWSKFERMNPAVTLNYMRGITNYIDFMGRFTTSFLKYPGRSILYPATSENFYMEADANINLKLLPDNYWIVPYVQAGVGISKERTNYHSYMPVGLGLQFNLYDQVYVHINSNYRIAISPGSNYSFLHSLGVSVPIKENKVETVVVPPPPVAEPPKDKDGDGVLDDNDMCPDVAGLSSLRGCPDADKDGIADKDDKCPGVAGMARYNGCPVPDTDKDGINDEEDKCISVSGVARYNGCPVPDTDGDGVNDEEDKCPAVVGVASNAGCPEIKPEVITKVEFAAKNVFFNTGSYQLQKKSYAPLNEVAKILKDNPTLQLDVEGHTDNTGDAAKNQMLSDNRAHAVKAYLIAQGVEGPRLTAAGFGPDRPVADNKTAAGKTKNRRVELKLRSY